MPEAEMDPLRPFRHYVRDYFMRGTDAETLHEEIDRLWEEWESDRPDDAQ